MLFRLRKSSRCRRHIQPKLIIISQRAHTRASGGSRSQQTVRASITLSRGGSGICLTKRANTLRTTYAGPWSSNCVSSSNYCCHALALPSAPQVYTPLSNAHTVAPGVPPGQNTRKFTLQHLHTVSAFACTRAQINNGRHLAKAAAVYTC